MIHLVVNFIVTVNGHEQVGRVSFQNKTERKKNTTRNRNYK